MERAHLGTLVETMEGWGAAPAVVEHRGVRRFRASYAEVAGLARGFAGELLRRGIGPGERVLLWGPNGAAWTGAFFGCVLRGVLPVPLDAGSSREFAETVARETGARLLVGQPGLLEGVPALPFHALGGLPARRVEPAALGPETPLQILFTSGTTGMPKGVVHTHGNLLASLGPIEREIGKYRRYERWIHPLHIAHTLPLSHIFGQFMGLWVAPALGAVTHYEERPGELLDLLPRERAHVLAAVPRTLALLRSRLADEFPGLEQAIEDARALPWRKRWWRFRAVHRRLGWRFIAAVCGGATLPPELEQFWTGLGCALVQGYGLTETAALVTLNHPFKVTRGSLGTPLPGRELRVNNEGELEVAGAMVAAGVWEGGQIVERASPWLKTGDLAEMGRDGRLRFRGRTGQRLVTAAGLNVYLQDLEEALEREPDIAEAAAVAVPGIGGGEEPAAVITGALAGVDRANQALAPHQRMLRAWVWPEPRLPRTASGKVRRAEVEAWARGQALEAAPAQAADPAVGLLLSLGLRPGPGDDGARLDEDWGLDSMGRVALAASLESADDVMGRPQTLGELRAALGTAPARARSSPLQNQTGPKLNQDAATPPHNSAPAGASPPAREQSGFNEARRRITETEGAAHRYPGWPFSLPARGFRVLFTELLARPLVFLFARPTVTAGAPARGPLLVISNHRTAVDLALLQAALPFPIRSRLGVAMSGEKLLGWENGWNRRPLHPEIAGERRWWGPIAAPLVRLLFGVFPLPRTSGFRQSFSFAGRLLDRGCSVLLFPQGRRAGEDEPLRFRPGIGILAREAYVPVLPAALLIAREGNRVRVGTPVEARGGPEAVISELEAAVRRLLKTEK